MAIPSPEDVWRLTDEELLSMLNGLLLRRTGVIRFYAPSFMYYKTSQYCSSSTAFPTISITGKGCALKCEHCGGTVLKTMYPAKTPQKLFQLCEKLKAKGAVGCLVSGGCLPNGSVPLQQFVEVLGRVKRELSLTVLVHTGIIDLDGAKSLKEASVDAALIDVIGSDETIERIYNLNVTVADYASSLKALHDSGVRFVPHIIVGLHYGKLKGESVALDIVRKYTPSALVVIAFMPIRGTNMANVAPSSPADIARVIAVARLKFPETPLVLGCMRPKGKHRAETDVLAIKAGVDAIAFPAEEAVELAKCMRFETSFSPTCCSQIYTDVANLYSRR
jgi:uncharacterized radical SAM superfamily protein